MKPSCIGAGYVGGPTIINAEKCPDINITLVDSNSIKFAWNGDLDNFTCL